MRFSDSWASVLLDLVRGLAAILVLLSHWKVMFFLDYPKIPGERWMFVVPYVLCDAGHQAVIIFFVLSGYLIAGSVFRSLDRGTWSWGDYLVHRLTRLWVVLIPGLVLGFLLDWAGMHLAHTPSLYAGSSAKAHFLNVPAATNWPTFFGNVLFLQTLRYLDFGSNNSLWSLANEFWYYLLFPLGLLGLRSGSLWFKRAAWLLLGAAIAWVIRRPLLPLFPVWVAGAGLDFLPKRPLGARSRWLAAGVYVPCIFLFAKVRMSDTVRDYGFAAVTVLFLWVLLSARNAAAAGPAVKPIRSLARFSFSLYVLHMPALMLLTALFVGEQLWSPKGAAHDAVAVVLLGVVLLYAYGVARLTEFHTDKVRRWVERLVRTGPGRRAAAAD